MAKTEERFVLAAPKAICLKTGEIAVIGEKFYAVQIPHELDEFRNEYEVSRKGDA
ncbi:hypothetical protein SDC9_207578 [bioreactor metagenome]|uniref:Uncharacterized protein n=1 Tax=bioreactor metagenome TaxID=1076179 RepID=A0A645J8V0_9ZZZZ